MSVSLNFFGLQIPYFNHNGSLFLVNTSTKSTIELQTLNRYFNLNCVCALCCTLIFFPDHCLSSSTSRTVILPLYCNMTHVHVFNELTISCDKTLCVVRQRWQFEFIITRYQTDLVLLICQIKILTDMFNLMLHEWILH